MESTGDVNNSILYSGYQYDKETGLYYLNARMYDPKTARFLQEDTYTGDSNDPLSLNLYTYGLNNPIIYWDPTGHRNLIAEYKAKKDKEHEEAVKKAKEKIDKGTGNLVTVAQLKEFGWFDTSNSFVKKLNDALIKYGITNKESIALFMATMAAESTWGKDTLEQGDDDYFVTKKYGKSERGAGYIQITWDATHTAFLKTMNDSYSGADTATYIAEKYPMEASAWYWSNMEKTGEHNLNAYVMKNGDSLGIFLITQYYVNGFADGIGDDLASIRRGNSFTINKYEDVNSVSLSVNGHTYRLPNGWDDREDAYNKAIKAFSKLRRE